MKKSSFKQLTAAIVAMLASNAWAIDDGGLSSMLDSFQSGKRGGDVQITVTPSGTSGSGGYSIYFAGNLAAVRTAGEGAQFPQGFPVETLDSPGGKVYVVSTKTNKTVFDGAKVGLYCLPAAGMSLQNPGVNPAATGTIQNGIATVHFDGDCRNPALSNLNRRYYLMNAIIEDSGYRAWFGIGSCGTRPTIGAFQSCSAGGNPLIAFTPGGQPLSPGDKSIIKNKMQ